MSRTAADRMPDGRMPKDRVPIDTGDDRADPRVGGDGPALTGCADAGDVDHAVGDEGDQGGDLGDEGTVPTGRDRAEEAFDVDEQGRARIRIGVTPEAIRTLKAALGAQVIPEVYVQTGTPVRIQRVSGSHAVDLDGEVPLPVKATPLTTSLLASLLAEHTYTYRVRTRSDAAGGSQTYEEETTPNQTALSAALAGAEWPRVPTLAQIIGTPVLRRDWSLLQHPGYDPASGLYLAPTVDLPPVPDRPTPAQVAKARHFVLTAVLGDFEWEDTASKANYVGLLVSQYLRRPLRALVPLAIISASAPGSGKTLLSALIGLLVGQQTPAWPAEDETALEKLITSTFTQDTGAVIFDNLDEGTVIASPTLANLLTGPVWSARILGRTGMGSWPNDRLWMVTGNNLRVGGDIASRSVYVGLKPAAPHPEQRTGFVLGDLETWIKDPAHRAELLWRLLVLVADWVAAGTPRDTGLPAMRQFTAWAHGTGGFLTHHGITGFLANLNTIRGMDAEDLKWAVFLTEWLNRFGPAPIRCSDVVENAAMFRDPMTGKLVDPWDGDFITDEDGVRPGTHQKLGRLLTGHLERWHGYPPVRVVAITDGHNKSPRYRVEVHHP